MAEIEGEIEPDIVAETDLIEVRRKIQEAEADLATARALGAEAYTAALAHLTTLQTKENIILQQQGSVPNGEILVEVKQINRVLLALTYAVGIIGVLCLSRPRPRGIFLFRA